MLKALPSLYLTIWLPRGKLQRQGFFSSFCQAVAGATQTSTKKVTNSVVMYGCAVEDITNNVISALKLADFDFIYLGLGWHGIPLLFIIQLFQLCWKLIVLTSPISSHHF